MKPFTLSTEAAVARIRAREQELHAFVTTRLDEAVEEAAALAKIPEKSELHGVPFSLKDEWDTAGFRTTGGSYRYRDRIPTIDCSVTETFKAAGAVLIGKTNLSDLGIAPEASSYVCGSVRNPYNLERTAELRRGSGCSRRWHGCF